MIPKLTFCWILIVLFVPTTRSAIGQQELPALVERISKAVVKLETFDSRGRQAGTGSGFFIEPDVLVTNRHVVRGAESASAKLPNGTTYAIAGVIGTSSTTDLVALKVDGSTAATLPLRDTLPRPGERLVVIGSPLGLEQSVSDGIVSAIREIEGYGTVIQITAPISPGSSGSPVVDMDGKVVGIATFLFIGGQNLNFAIPASHITEIARSSVESLGTWWSTTSRKEEEWQATFAAHYDVRLDAIRVGSYEVTIESDGLRFKTTYTSDVRWKGKKYAHSGHESIVFVEQLDGAPVAIAYEGEWPWGQADLEYRFERDRLFCIRRQDGREQFEEQPNSLRGVLMPIAAEREYVSKSEERLSEFAMAQLAVDTTGLSAVEQRWAALPDEPFELDGQGYSARVWRTTLQARGTSDVVEALQKVVMHTNRPVFVYQKVKIPLGTVEYVLRQIGE